MEVRPMKPDDEEITAFIGKNVQRSDTFFASNSRNVSP